MLHAIEKSIDIYMDKPAPPSPEPGARG